jgi:hypothetical protein
MNFFTRTFALLALAGGLGALPVVGQDVKVDYDHNVALDQYHTYSWGKVQTSDPLNQDRVKQEVDRDLQAKGWQMVPKGGQVTLVAVGATHNKQEYNSFYDGMGGGGWGWRRGWGGGGFGETYTTVDQIPIGTLVLDMYDPQSHKLIWRGTASDTLSSKPEKNTEKLDKAIDKMLDKFPPKGAK